MTSKIKNKNKNEVVEHQLKYRGMSLLYTLVLQVSFHPNYLAPSNEL